MSTMKLTDIKKLKVAELRSRLKEVGLDSGGLKAELVERLWSALQGGQSWTHSDIQVKLQHDNLQVTPSPLETEELCAPSSSEPVKSDIPAPCRTREYTESGTQTETDAGSTTQQPGSEFVSESARDRPRDGEALQGRGRAFYEFKEEIRYKRAKSPQPPADWEETEDHEKDNVRLDPCNSHLHFEVVSDGSCGQPRFWAQFPALWSGSRLTHGVLEGRVGFEVRLEKKLLSTQLEEEEDPEPYGVRVGWSVAGTSLLLGEEELSFAYDGRSKKVSGGKEEEFGEPFSEGDIIGCYASFSTDSAVQLSFHKNGCFMGVAYSLRPSVLQGRPLFPHIICKSYSVRFLLEPMSPPWYPSPPGFTPLAALPAGQRVLSSSAPSSKAQCETLLMVGLPGSGKTHWARTHMKQHPEKQYRLLGTQELLTCMMSGGRRESRLQQASQCLTYLIKIAAQTPGNYILDQCNILFSARRHKLQLFTGFRRRVVVIFPHEDEWKRRLLLRQTNFGEQIPETALLKLKVSCSLPEEQADLLDELHYAELPGDQAQTLLQEYKDRARRLLPPIPKQEKKKPRLPKKRPLPHGPPPSHRIHWTGIYDPSVPRLNMQQWSQHPRYWNVAYRSQNYNSNKNIGYVSCEDYW